MAAIDYPDLWRRVVAQFIPDEHSIHGPAHWRRVEKIGVRLAEMSGADVEVVRLFALFHDSCRWDDGADIHHGPRGATLAKNWLTGILAAERLETLTYACAHHTDGDTHADATIGTCWDSDRMDLARLNIEPEREFLSTAAAKEREFIRWATGLCGRTYGGRR